MSTWVARGEQRALSGKIPYLSLGERVHRHEGGRVDVGHLSTFGVFSDLLRNPETFHGGESLVYSRQGGRPLAEMMIRYLIFMRYCVCGFRPRRNRRGGGRGR